MSAPNMAVAQVTDSINNYQKNTAMVRDLSRKLGTR
jgi:hypothetical protein